MRPILILADSYRNAEIILKSEGLQYLNRASMSGTLKDGRRFKVVAPADEARMAERVRGTEFSQIRFIPVSFERKAHPDVVAQAKAQTRPHHRRAYK